jgi:hypothetical protein
LRAQDGHTLLHIAAYNDHASVVTLLCERGANKEAKNDVRTRHARAHTSATQHILQRAWRGGSGGGVRARAAAFARVLSFLRSAALPRVSTHAAPLPRPRTAPCRVRKCRGCALRAAARQRAARQRREQRRRWTVRCLFFGRRETPLRHAAAPRVVLHAAAAVGASAGCHARSCVCRSARRHTHL